MEIGLWCKVCVVGVGLPVCKYQPVGEVCLVQASSIKNKASLAVSFMMELPLQDRVIRYATARTFPHVGDIVGQTCLLHYVLSIRNFSSLLQVRNLLRDLEPQEKLAEVSSSVVG